MDGTSLILLAAALFFGFMATEGTVEYFLGTLFERLKGKPGPDGKPTYPLLAYQWTLMYVSAVLGIFLAFHYSLDIPSVLLGLPASYVGVILTGIVIGRGANFVSDVWGRFLGQPPARTVAVAITDSAPAAGTSIVVSGSATPS